MTMWYFGASRRGTPPTFVNSHMVPSGRRAASPLAAASQALQHGGSCEASERPGNLEISGKSVNPEP